MAYVRLKRNWFGPGGTRYRQRDGLIEVPDNYVPLLPSDAEVFDSGGRPLPSKALEPVAGFGAKPLHEQMLDLIPHAAPMHVEKTAVSGVSAVAAPLTEEEKKEHDKAAEASVDVLRAASQGGDPRDREKRHEEEQTAIQKGVELAADLKEEQDKVLDPVAAAATAASKSPALKGSNPPVVPPTPPASPPKSPTPPPPKSPLKTDDDDDDDDDDKATKAPVKK